MHIDDLGTAAIHSFFGTFQQISHHLLLTGKWLKLKYFRLKFLGQTAKEN
jgi:hypothetical protein